jgi:O-acetyl-ADP-ribose deacetylase (regulator of RNase III)
MPEPFPQHGGVTMRETSMGCGQRQLMLGDITTLGQHVGAIVNAANETLRPGGGVCGAIHRAGGPDVAIECRWIGSINVGQAVATTAGLLDADAIIHAVGPVWQGGNRGEDRLLSAAYRSSLGLAAERGLTSVAFPSISTGIFGYPIDHAATVAVGTIAAFLKQPRTVTRVILVLHAAEDYQMYNAALERWERVQAARSVGTPA